MIDEKKLIEEMEQSLKRMVADEDGKHPVSLERVIEVIKEQPKVGEWIPVSERLPDETGGDYYPAMNVTTRKGEVGWGFYRCDDGYWYLYNEEMQEWKIVENGQVIAWMALPEPYKEK